MNLQLIQSTHVDQFWDIAKPMLEAAIAKNHGEATIDQLKMQVSSKAAHLVLSETDGIFSGAAVIEFEQQPNIRIAHISYLGGKGIITDEAAMQLGEWCKSMGASELRAFCGESQARLFGRVGYQEIYRVMRLPL